MVLIHSFSGDKFGSYINFRQTNFPPILSMPVHLHTSSPQWFTTPSMMVVVAANADAAFFRIET